MINEKTLNKVNEFLKSDKSKNQATEDYISRRINHRNFAKLIVWLCSKSKQEQYIFSSYLVQDFKVTTQWVNQSLNGLVHCNLLEKKGTGLTTEYWFVKNSDNYKIEKYFDKAIQTLGIK